MKTIKLSKPIKLSKRLMKIIEDRNVKELLKCQSCGKPFEKLNRYQYMPKCECYGGRIMVSVG